MTANEAREIILNEMRKWKTLPEVDMEFGEAKGPVSEDDYSFYFEIPEYDRQTGQKTIQLYEVNKSTRQVYRVVEEYD